MPIWIGTTAVWTTAANWSPAAAPVDTENVQFTGAVTQSVDGSTLGAGVNDFPNVYFHEDWAGDCGSSGTPVTAGDSTKLVFAARSGRAYWTVAAGDTLAEVIYKASSGRSDALTLAAAGNITTIRIQNASGGVVLNSGAVTTVEMTNSPNCVLTIASAVTGLQDITIAGGGTIDNSAVVTTGTGTVRIAGGRYIRRSTGSIDKLEMYGNGVKSILEDYASGTMSLTGSRGFISGKGSIVDGRGNRNIAVTESFFTVVNGAQILLDNSQAAYLANVATDGTAFVDAATTITYM